MHRGYVKLFRKLNDWQYKKDLNMLALWVDLLTNAAYKKTYDRFGHELAPGQLSTGRNQLAARTGLTPSQVRTCLDKLKSSHQINQQRKSKCSIITITNWNQYCEDHQQDRHQIAIRSPHLKNVKNVKNKKKENTLSLSEKKFPDEAVGVSTQLVKLMQENNPNVKIPTNLDKWNNESRLILERDKRPLNEVMNVLEFCQKDSFWKSNILSVGKFRKKYDQLKLKMEGSHGKNEKFVKSRENIDFTEGIPNDYFKQNKM